MVSWSARPQSLWSGLSLFGVASVFLEWPQSLWSGLSLFGVASVSLEFSVRW